jgi:hypothetical protein
MIFQEKTDTDIDDSHASGGEARVGDHHLFFDEDAVTSETVPLSAVSDVVARAWPSKGQGFAFTHDLVWTNHKIGKVQVIRAEAKVSRMSDHALIVIVRDDLDDAPCLVNLFGRFQESVTRKAQHLAASWEAYCATAWTIVKIFIRVKDVYREAEIMVSETGGAVDCCSFGPAKMFLIIVPNCYRIILNCRSRESSSSPNGFWIAQISTLYSQLRGMK